MDSSRAPAVGAIHCSTFCQSLWRKMWGEKCRPLSLSPMFSFPCIQCVPWFQNPFYLGSLLDFAKVERPFETL